MLLVGCVSTIEDTVHIYEGVYGQAVSFDDTSDDSKVMPDVELDLFSGDPRGTGIPIDFSVRTDSNGVYQMLRAPGPFYLCMHGTTVCARGTLEGGKNRVDLSLGVGRFFHCREGYQCPAGFESL